MRRLLAALFASLTLVACEPAPAPVVNAQGCPPGEQFVSAQGWWQLQDASGGTAVPQALPASEEGGHMHVDLCFPVNQRVDGDTLELVAIVRSHQRLTAVGDRIDVGLAPGGSTVVAVPAPDMSIGGPHCGGDPDDPHLMCSARVPISVPLDGIPSGPQRFRIRYLSAEHPSGDRQFISNELPFWLRTDPGACVEVEGKGWYDARNTGGSEIEYARAGVRDCLPGVERAVSGTFTFRQSARSTNFPITAMSAFVDARFGHDEFTGRFAHHVVTDGSKNLTRTVSLDTTQLADGIHCVAVVTQAQDPLSDGVNTGVLEFPILVDNPTPGSIAGRGSCFPPTTSH